MELIPGRLYFATEKEWRGNQKRFPSKGIRVDKLYRMNESKAFGVPSIQSILFHCSEVDRRLQQYEALVYTTTDE